MPDVRAQTEHAGSRAPATGGSSPLRDIFADLISYVLLFQATCGEHPLAANAVREKIDALIAEQDRRVKTGEASWDSYREAFFAVLSWVDEVVLNSRWPYRGQWRHLMLGTFGTLNAGKEFFPRLDNLPPAARDVKEIYFLCLGLGFEGAFALGGNTEQLREYRRRLYRDIGGAGAVQRDRLFPEAYGGPRAPARVDKKRIGIVWFALAILVPVLCFGVYWYLLDRQTRDLLALRPAPDVPRQPKCTLVEELRARGIQAAQAPRGVVITLPNVLFEFNSAALSFEGQKKIMDVAAALGRHAGGFPVLVEGHASRERGTQEEQNQRLSLDRATNVVALLRESGLRNESVSARAFGSSSPLVSNDTEEGRRQNRRVEIIVETSRAAPAGCGPSTS